MIRPENIPYRQQRLLVTKFMASANKLITHFFFSADHDWAVQQETYIAYYVWMAHLQGQAVTVQNLSRRLGIPRATLKRKLDYIVDQGYAQRIGTRYFVADDIANDLRCSKKLIDLMYKTVDELRTLESVK